ncbi:MAG: DUF418 domain-containing protein [Phycisphaerales bacterium JB059]
MQTALEPVRASERVAAIDVIRGFALLGILGPNILAFSWPSSVQFAPEVMSDALALTSHASPNDRANELGHTLVQVFFHGKMMCLFSMLFGAGVLLYARKFEREPGDACFACGLDLTTIDAGPRVRCPKCGRRNPARAPRLSDGAALWYTRCVWLLAIGLLHAFLLWYGDILVWYALTGLGLVWWIRRIRPVAQIVLGVLLYLFGTATLTGFMLLGLHYQGPEALLGNWAGEVRAYTGAYTDAFTIRTGQLLFTYLFLLPLGFGFSLTGLMTLGMALTRLGVLTGQRSDRFYLLLCVSGLSLGLTLTLVLLALLDRTVQLPGFIFMGAGQLVGIPTALGYASALILLVRRGWLTPLTHALSAVGRMALSNYLLQTILCTTLFYGYGVGLFGRVQYPALWLVVGGVWLTNIVFSLLWLRFFRFGPAEWLWRSLTYLKLQPMRRAPANSPG